MPSPAQRPFIHLNVAVTCNGSMTAGTGAVRSISSKADWRRVHHLREQYTAIAVGARTWILDTPKLTARREHLGREPRRQPDRVIFAGAQPCVIPPDRRRTFVIGCCEDEAVIAIPSRDRRLERPLAVLSTHGVESMLVEGGATLLRSFITQGCYDRITVFVPTERKDEAAAVAAVALPSLPAPLKADADGGGVLLSYGPPGMIEDPHRRDGRRNVPVL